METHSKERELIDGRNSLKAPTTNGSAVKHFSNDDVEGILQKIADLKSFFQHNRDSGLEEVLKTMFSNPKKESFLVFKNNKYITVPTENVVFFYVRNESTIIVSSDQQEHLVNLSLDQIQSLVEAKQFFRINRQYLVNFCCVKEVEHYYARKLLVNLTVIAPEQLLVTKEKVTSFLNWLDNR